VSEPTARKDVPPGEMVSGPLKREIQIIESIKQGGGAKAFAWSSTLLE
jgi:hypothetical protein